jgi:hypothetical protein
MRGRVSKQATNGSSTALLGVIGFLCVSLDSSTVQLHVSLGRRRACEYSEAGFSGQNGDRAWVYYRRAAICYAILWEKRLNTKDIHKQLFPVYGGKSLSRKAVHNRVHKFSQGRSKVAYGGRPNAQVPEKTVRTLLCCGFWSTNKAMGQVSQCWWRICVGINAFFQFRISHILRFITICGLFTDPLIIIIIIIIIILIIIYVGGMRVSYNMGFGLDVWIFSYLIHKTRDYRQYSAIAYLHTLQFPLQTH